MDKITITKNIIILILILSAGCGIFDTRTPENPNLTRSTFIPPTNPEAVITNLTYSIIEKNSNNYQKCINSLSYQYVPDSKSQQIYGSIFVNWTAGSEKNYYDNLISQTKPTASSNLFLSNKELRQINTDSAIFNADYIMVYQHDKPNIPKSSYGNLRLTITTDNINNFYINKWEDFRKNDTDFTWSELKANFSN